MRRMIGGLCALMVTTLIVGACRPRPKAPLVETGVVIAEVGDLKILDRDLLARIQQIEAEFPRKYDTHPQKVALLNEMIHLELLYQEALARALDRRYEFKAKLADLYLQDLSEAARATITEKEIQAFYDRNREAIDQVSARHILLKTEGKSDSEIHQIRTKIRELHDQVRKAPETFEEVARKNSQDGSAQNGGNLGFFVHAQMAKPFSDAAFALKNPLEISPIVETKFGFHIIQLVDARRGIEFARDRIRSELLKRTQRGRLDQELDRLKAMKKIQIYEDNLLKMSSLPDSIQKQ